MKLSVVVLSLLALQACTNQPSSRYNVDVAEAISSSGSIVIAPYERTIFSSSNF